jgi:hypothetical protein
MSRRVSKPQKDIGLTAEVHTLGAIVKSERLCEHRTTMQSNNYVHIMSSKAAGLGDGGG